MNLPLIMLFGKAGSGKNTVASMISSKVRCVEIAQADPIKRLGKYLFEFTDDQLWGPSELRNAPDHRSIGGPPGSPYNVWIPSQFRGVTEKEELVGEASGNFWYNRCEQRFGTKEVQTWIKEIALYDPDRSAKNVKAMLETWFSYIRWITIQEHKPITPRLMLQTMGQEARKVISSSLWNDICLKNSMKILRGGFKYDPTTGIERITPSTPEGPDVVIITDGRFKNELLAVRAINGVVVNIVDGSNGVSDAERAGIIGHPSETEQNSIPNHFFDYIIYNDKSMGVSALEGKVNKLIQALGNPVLL